MIIIIARYYELNPFPLLPATLCVLQMTLAVPTDSFNCCCHRVATVCPPASNRVLTQFAWLLMTCGQRPAKSTGSIECNREYEDTDEDNTKIT